MDYAKQNDEAIAQIKKWMDEGKITRKYHIVNGLSKAPYALESLFNGLNTGKL